MRRTSSMSRAYLFRVELSPALMDDGPRRQGDYAALVLTVRGSIAATAAAAGLFTLLAGIGPLMSLASRNASLHVATETAAALISIVAAQLAWGRFRQSLERRDLLLTGSLAVFAATNLLLAVAAIADSRPGAFETWSSSSSRLLGAALLATAAVVPEQVLRQPMRDARRLAGGVAAGLGLIVLVMALAHGALPAPHHAGLPPGDLRPHVAGNPVLLVSELSSMVLFAIAAVGYVRQAETRGDPFAQWLAIAATLGAFSRLNFFVFSSLSPLYFATGEVLRLGFFVAIAVGGALEMRRIRRLLASAAVLDERQRIGREIHDGVAQDLAFILQHGRRLAAQAGAPSGVQALVTAAERALDECRHAIATLTRSGEEPLAEALTLTAVETAGREGALVETHIDRDVAVPAAAQDALLRVTREAIINAVRHGHAGTVEIHLHCDPALRLEVVDDGSGFDVDRALTAPGRMGLRSMQSRIREVGGTLVIDSEPGRGTRIEASLG